MKLGRAFLLTGLTVILSSLICQASVKSSGVEAQRKLTLIRSQVLSLERQLIDNYKDASQTSQRLRTLQRMMVLQRQERVLGLKRLQELENFISELENRRNLIQKNVGEQKTSIRKGLRDLARSIDQRPVELPLPEGERLEGPKRKLISRLVGRRLHEIDALRVDLKDADALEAKIQEEKQQLAYWFQDLKEQQSLLEFHQSLQADLLQKKHAQRIAQLQNYRGLKSSEAQLEHLMDQFNARMELKRSEEAQRSVSQSMLSGEFTKLKGKLSMPVRGEVVSQFGQAFDTQSQLHVFHKGIEIDPGHAQPVRAVAGGKVVYSGVLPGYGNVTIMDHGGHYYTLVGRLGELKRQVGDVLIPGDDLGSSDSGGQPVYFEIRSRNVAVNPLQWIVN